MQVPAVHLTYTAAEAQLLAAAAAIASSNSAAGQAVTPSTAPQQLQQQQQRPQPLLRRLLLCGCGVDGSSTAGGCSVPQPLRQQCQQEQVLQLSRTPLCDGDGVHLALLQAVYCAYTGKPLSVSTAILAHNGVGEQS
jgi:hypothetical protein